MPEATKELVLSFATVILTILAIIIFIYQQGSSTFYIIAIVTMIVGFVNAWLISKRAPKGNSPLTQSNNAKKKLPAKQRK
jgi:multisubunit Na+/H+ antiporter MnhF subunit